MIIYNYYFFINYGNKVCLVCKVCWGIVGDRFGKVDKSFYNVKGLRFCFKINRGIVRDFKCVYYYEYNFWKDYFVNIVKYRLEIGGGS